MEVHLVLLIRLVLHGEDFSSFSCFFFSFNTYLLFLIKKIKKNLLSELRFDPKKPMMLFCDNMTTIEITNDLVQHDRSKHIELDKNYIKDNLDIGMIKVSYIKSADQLVNMMTRVVTSGPFMHHYPSWACARYLCTNLRRRVSFRYNCVQMKV